MPYIVVVIKTDDEDPWNPLYQLQVADNDPFAALDAAREALRPLEGPGEPVDPLASDVMSHFIRSLPTDVRNSFNLPLALDMFQITAENVLELDTPHRRDALIHEIRRRDRANS